LSSQFIKSQIARINKHLREQKQTVYLNNKQTQKQQTEILPSRNAYFIAALSQNINLILQPSKRQAWTVRLPRKRLHL
jgi:hypothetical protein